MARALSTTARTKMLRAAADVVVDVGIGRFAVDEVARRSGVAKTTIYRHFPDQKALLVAALDDAMHAPPVPDTGSLRDDLLAYLDSVGPQFADRRLRTLFFELFLAAERDPELRRLSDELLAGRVAPTSAIYEHAHARGELAPGVDYATMLDVVQGPLVLRSLTRPESLTALDLDAMVDRIIAALSA
jgi:AcrR family transcriptional regulator